MKTWLVGLKSKLNHFLMNVLLCFFLLAMTSVFAATSLPPLPLSTSGNQIIDAQGNPITLQGVNWFGFETQNHVPHGLWSRDYKDMLKQISSLGFNVIRLPFSLQALRSTNTSGIDYASGRNTELNGKTPQEIMDIIIDEAAKNHLMVILDNHSQSDDGFMYDLWYGQGGFTEDDWVQTWKNLAARYATKTNVIGADLKNEPHGAATWGTGEPTDWRRAAERAGNEILAINPKWLIIVEGIEGPVAGGQVLDRNWWGGNLEGVHKNPVRLNRANKLVYSPHEYGPEVYAQPWFSDSNMSSILDNRWATGFGYIHDQNIAPILVGEFGAKQVSLDTTEGKWFRQFTNYMSQKGMNWTFWSWNPNSGDTGGVLKDDWKTVHNDKMTILTALINKEAIPYTSDGTTPTPTPEPTPIPEPTPTPTPEPTPEPTPTPSGTVAVQLILDSKWETGYCGKLAVLNDSSQTISINTIAFDLPASDSLANLWNGSYHIMNNHVTVTTPTWAKASAKGKYIDTGLCVKGTAPLTNLTVLFTTPNGSGTGGTTTPIPMPDPMPPAPTEPTPTPEPTSSQLKVTFIKDSTWSTGFCRSTSIVNNGNADANGWTLTFTLPTSVNITQSWSGTVSRSGQTVTVTPPTWGKVIKAGQTVKTFGFCASGQGEPAQGSVTSP